MPGPASGVVVSTDSKNVYDEVKKDKKYRYIIYYIKEEKTIEVEVRGEREATYKDFLLTLQNYKSECRYCLFDFPVSVDVGGNEDKPPMTVDRLVLMTWCPESSKIKQKMLYSSSCDALKKALVGTYKYVQACDFEEADETVIVDSLKKGGK
ncbi:cofilin/actin-depolymerizing factor homolog isoform X1 [Tachypleus tridentatus]|uniref:cofilin/actin-depolymerizing factor homolog isoform X1 n=1 Tax=Tachypleus tridentatus TaxID=6853 RepID=UPI003FD22D92